VTAGTIERAELVAAVDELVAWKKSFCLRQAEEIAWKAMIMDKFMELNESDKTIIQGCMTMMETDTALSERIEHLSERMDIANKRIRRLEQAVERLTPR